MDFELRRAREKLAKEQSERKERARLRLERERKARAEASRQRDAIEASQRSRRPAVQAQLKADQDMQESLLVGRGVVFYRLLEAVPYDGNGDKIKLPASCCAELSDQGAFDKGPLYFQLSLAGGEGSDRTTHSGVLEFTAEEGSVGIPPHVWRNLLGTDSMTSMVEVRYVWLPKGTYAKIQVDSAGFSDLPNHKAVLETSLRQHATLSQGDVFAVRYGQLTYKLRVLKLKPSSSVSVLETDLEVDLDDYGSGLASERTEQHVLKPLLFGKAESGTVDEGNYEYFKFSIDDATWEKVDSGVARVEIRIEAEGDGGDTDLYVSRHPLIFPTQHQHEWSSYDVGSKTLILGSTDKNFTVGNYSVGIYGFKGKTNYNLSLTIEDLNNRTVGQQAASSSSSVAKDTVECKNCNRHIPSHTIMLHEAYCSRHNVVCKHAGCAVVLKGNEAGNHVHCDICGQAFQKGEIEKHMKVFHEPVHCPCGVVLEKEQMVQHQGSSCPLRLIVCRFCGDMVTAGSSAPDARDRMRGLTEHESVCGSRTAPCDSCGRSVMLKEMDIHHTAVHQKN